MIMLANISQKSAVENSAKHNFSCFIVLFHKPVTINYNLEVIYAIVSVYEI